MTAHAGKTTRKAGRKALNLALQGGGAHGAFTWGVLDRILKDDRIDIVGLSGTSAGAMNAAAFADGYALGGVDGARERLKSFWSSVSQWAKHSPIQRSIFDIVLGNWSLDYSPSYHAFDLITRFASPYQFNPLNINPLRDLIDESIDFDHVRKCDQVKLFVAATNVHSGKIRVFEGDDLSTDALMASACLPLVFQAVEIDGVPYWDGGYMGNPPLYPLFYATECNDILLVQINPVERAETPRTATQIHNRLNEITFNSTLLRELRAIAFVGQLISEGKLSSNEYRKILFHRVSADEELIPLSSSSKMNSEWRFLRHLRDIGRRTADQWLDQHFDDLGTRSSLDLEAFFS